MFQGYAALGGVELANARRTKAYVDNMLPTFPLKDCDDCDGLRLALLDAPYDSPILDGASWIDQSNPATYDFLGFYPLSITGVDDSTTQAEVVQSITSGGYNGQQREATREIRVSGVLVAMNALGLDAGYAWLREALRSQACEQHDGSCSGSSFCYYAACPEIVSCYHPPAAGEEGVLTNVRAADGVRWSHPGLSDRDLDLSTEFFTNQDGFTFTYGYGVVASGEIVQRYGPITPQRTNYVRNPQLSVDTTGWVAASNVAITRTSDVGGSYAHIVPTGVSPLATVALDGAQSGPARLSFRLRAATGGTVTVRVHRVSDNAIMESFTFTTTTGLLNYSTALATAAGRYISFASATTIDVTNVLVEGGSLQMSYFDGDTIGTMPRSGAANAPTPEYEVSWLGAPNDSASRMTWLGRAIEHHCGVGLSGFVEAVADIADIRFSMAYGDAITAEEQAEKYERTMHDVTAISGVTTVRVFDLDEGAGAQVEFLLSASTPFAFHPPRVMLDAQQLELLPTVEFADPAPVTPPVFVIVDPDCPPIPAPPRPPVIPNTCADGPDEWDRYYVEIPGDEVSVWSKNLMTVSLHAPSEVRQVRVRLTENPFSWPVGDVDPAAFCSEFILSYLPANTELTVDGTVQRAWASIEGSEPIPASNLLYGADGGPMTWPEVSCGVPYLVTIDVPVGAGAGVVIDLELTKRS